MPLTREPEVHKYVVVTSFTNFFYVIFFLLILRLGQRSRQVLSSLLFFSSFPFCWINKSYLTSESYDETLVDSNVFAISRRATGTCHNVDFIVKKILHPLLKILCQCHLSSYLLILCK